MSFFGTLAVDMTMQLVKGHIYSVAAGCEASASEFVIGGRWRFEAVTGECGLECDVSVSCLSIVFCEYSSVYRNIV